MGSRARDSARGRARAPHTSAPGACRSRPRARSNGRARPRSSRAARPRRRPRSRSSPTWPSAARPPPRDSRQAGAGRRRSPEPHGGATCPRSPAALRGTPSAGRGKAHPRGTGSPRVLRTADVPGRSGGFRDRGSRPLRGGQESLPGGGRRTDPVRPRQPRIPPDPAPAVPPGPTFGAAMRPCRETSPRPPRRARRCRCPTPVRLS